MVTASYNVPPMDAPAFREWARLMHGKSDTVYEDAVIAATVAGQMFRVPQPRLALPKAWP